MMITLVTIAAVKIVGAVPGWRVIADPELLRRDC